jgi:hypothetical protein
MSDEQQRRGGAGRGGPEPDETREFDPLAPEENEPDGGPRSGDAWIADRTEQMPRAGADDAETVLTPRPDATSIMPAVEAGAGRLEAAARAAAGGNDADYGAGSPAWSGRAEVRPPRPGAGGDFTGDWGPPPPSEPRGKWWLPIVIGIVVLVLLALLGWGVWLIVQAGDKSGDSTTPAATTSAAAPETTKPTTKPPTTEPTTTPTTTDPTGPEEVTIPALNGLSSAEARRALDRTGLAYRLRFVTSDAPAGTVIDSDPKEGLQVPSDTTVTLIIAAPPSSSPTVTTTKPTTAPTDTNGQTNDD